MKRLLLIALAALAALSLLAAPAFAGDKPLVMENGQTKQLPASTPLLLPNITGLTQCVQADASGNLTGAGRACVVGGGSVLSGAGAPAPSTDPIGTLYTQTDIADLYQQVVPTTIALGIVQVVSAAGTNSVTLGAAPVSGHLLVAACSGYTTVPTANTGWTTYTSAGVNVSSPGDVVVYHQVVSGDSAAQTPCTSVLRETVTVWEVSGAPQWAQVIENTVSTYSTTPLTATTGHNNDLVLGMVYSEATSDPGAPTISSGVTSNPTSAHAGGGSGVATKTDIFATSGATVSMSWSGTGAGSLARLLVLKPPSSGWQKISRMARFQDGSGTDLSTEPMVFKCSTGLTCTVSASPYGVGDLITVTASGGSTGANPSATASDTAVNGSAATFMRSDAAPAIQKGSSSVFGVVKADGTTITAAGGVLSASVSGAAISGTPTTGNCAKWASSTALGDAGAACGSGGSGTTINLGNMTLIQTQTLGSTAASVAFSSIPSGFTDLVLVSNARGDTSATAVNENLVFNGDTGTNYFYQRVSGGTSSVSAANNFNQTVLFTGSIPGATSTASYAGQITSTISSYANTTFFKSVVSEAIGWTTPASAGGNMNVVGSAWASTAAINSITISPASGNFVAGSTFSLYGRGGAVPSSTLPGTYTVATLPAATTKGLQAFVTDATACTFGSTVTGGGSTGCPVYADGSAWRAG